MGSPRILISAGEASGDLYASALVDALRRRLPDAEFFGCTGPRMREAGVRQVIDAASLAVVGLVEVVAHIPRIYGEFRKLHAAARRERPDLAILTDSPSFHMRLAKKLRKMGVPVVYLVAPQVWAWKKWRLRQMRRDIDKLLCIFPFEEAFFREHRVDVTYIGHPLTRLARPTLERAGFFEKHNLPPDRPLVTLLPGSRAGEARRHLPPLVGAVRRLRAERDITFVLATPEGARANRPPSFWEPIAGSPIQVIEGETWDAIAHADLALAASGTVTVEAALLGTPMVTYYKVTPVSWWLGRYLVDVPFYSMVNLIAERQVVPELMQEAMTGRRLAEEARRLLTDGEARERMRQDLSEVRRKLSGAAPVDGDSPEEPDPMERAAEVVQRFVIE